MATRWGIASAGKISHDFAVGLATLPAEEHVLVGVAARDLSRAQDFAKLHNGQKAYGNYQDLANDRDIEVVYIGSLNPQHLEIAKLMLSNGKHVLCEKPLTLNLKQTTELINFAKEKGLFLMEAIWSRCFPTYQWIREEIESGNLGDIKQVVVPFGFQLTGIERVSKKDLGGGTILDLGVYNIQLASLAFNGEKPIAIQASGQVNEDGVDTSVSATLSYKNGRTATIVTQSHVALSNEAIIAGTKGILRVPQFWCPTEIIGPSGRRSFTLPEPLVKPFFIHSTGLRFEAAEVRRCIKAGLQESPLVSHRDSLLFAEIEDELRRQVGVVYAED